MAVEVCAGSVVAHGGSRVGVAGGPGRQTQPIAQEDASHHQRHVSAIRTGPRRPTGARSAPCRVPVQHAQGPEGVPSAGPSIAVVQLDGHRSGMAGL